MADYDSLLADAQDEEREIIEKNLAVRYYDFNEAKNLKKSAKINQQRPLIQKYWLGRLAYELANRNENVKNIIKQAKDGAYNDSFALGKLSLKNTLALKLDKYGFSAMPEDNVLETEHTSFPTYLECLSHGKININSIFAIEKLLDIIDGAPKSKYNQSDKNYKQWQQIGKVYINSKYFELISLDFN